MYTLYMIYMILQYKEKNLETDNVSDSRVINENIIPAPGVKMLKTLDSGNRNYVLIK